MGSNVVPAPPPGFTLVEDSAVPPPPAGFTLQQEPSAEVPPPPPGFTLIDGASDASPKTVGPDGSAVLDGPTVPAGAPRPVTQPSGTDLALQSMPAGFKLLSDATGLTGAANTVENALTSPDTPAQAASKARIRGAKAQPDESSLWSDLKQSYNTYTKGNLGAELSHVDDSLADLEANPKLEGTDLSNIGGTNYTKDALVKQRDLLLKSIVERHTAPKGPENPTYKALNMEENSNAASTLKNTITALGSDPWGVFRSAAAQSGAASVPSIIGGVAGAVAAGPPGAAVGAGLGSFQSEYGSDVIEGLEYFGADLSSEKSILETYRAHGPEIKSRARKKAAVVGFMDAASGGIEGRIAEIPVRGFSRRVAQMAAGTAVSSAGGMAGEAGGQIAQDGGISDYNAVYQEALGEVMPGAITEAGQIAGHQIKKLRVGGPMPTEDDLKRLWEENHPEEPISTYREAANAGRKLYGFAIEGQPTIMGSYESAEALAGQGAYGRGKLIAVSPDQVEATTPVPLTAIQVADAIIMDEGARNQMVDYIKRTVPAYSPLLTGVLKAVNKYVTGGTPGRVLQDIQAAWASNGTSVYNGPIRGLMITPREDNYLYGSRATSQNWDGLHLWSLTGRDESIGRTKTANAIDLDHLQELTDAENMLIVPGGIARRYQSDHGFEAVVDGTFNIASPEAKQRLLNVNDPKVVRDLFLTGQVTWKGRLDPRVLTAGLYDTYSGFQLLNQDGSTVDYTKVQELTKIASRKTGGNSLIAKDFGASMKPIQGGYSIGSRELDTKMEGVEKGVIAFGEHPQMAQFTAYLEKLRALGNMKQKFVLVLMRPVVDPLTLGRTWAAPGLEAFAPQTAQDTSNYMVNYSRRNGFFGVESQNTFIIGITDDANPASPFVWNEQSLIHTISHEFGHAMVASKLINAPLPTLLKVYSAFRRHRAAYDDQISANTRDQSFTEDISPGAWEARQKGPFRQQGNGDSPYHYGATMEEWLAEQMTRWAISDEVPMGAVTKFFKNTADAMKRVMKGLVAKGHDYQAEPEFNDWMRAIRDGESSAEYAAQIEEYRHIASTHVNSRVDPDPTPAHEDSADMYSVLDEFGPQRTPFMSTNMKSAIHNAGVTKAVVDKYNWFYKWAANLRQLAEANPHIKELQVARELFAFAKMESSKIMVSADTTLQAWRRLGDRRGRALSAFLFDLNEMNYLSDTERQAGVMRWPTSQEFIDLAKSYQFDNEMIAVYKDVRDFFLETIKREEELKLVDAQKITDPKLQLEAIAAAKKTSATLISKPYFPQTRFGKYTLTVRSKVNNKLEHFELFETKREAKLAAYQAVKMWPEADWDVVQSELREDVQQFTGMSPWMLDKIRNMPGLTKDQLLWIDELRYQIAPSQSFTKHMMRRKKYTGFSTDGRRTFASYAFHHARNYPRVKFADAFRDTIKELDMSLPPGYSPLERAKRKPMADLLQHQVNEFMNPSQDWAQLRAMNAIWHLGFNAKSAVVNMTQVFFSASFLGAKFGGVKAEGAILAAGAKLNTFYRKGAYHKSTDAEFRAIDRAMKDGHIDESMAAELAALAVGGGMGARIGKSLVGDSFLRGYIGFTEKAMWMFRMAEQWQRRVVFRAAWQLAVDNPSNIWVNSQAQKNPLMYEQLQKEGWSAREALAYLAGVDALQSTIGVYDRDSRARYAQGRKSVLFAFQSFTQQMLWTLWNNKDMWARYMLYYAVIGGSMGIIPDDFKGLLTLMGRMLFGNQFNLERSVREFITEMLGSDSKIPPDLILHGTARYGFGVPMIMQTLGAKFVPDVDLSPSITLNRLLPVDLGKLNMPGQKFNDVLAPQVEAASGAAYGIPIAIWKAISASDMDVTDFKRWEGAMPSAARNVSKAFRYGFGQGERDKNFATTVGFDGEDPEQLGEIIATALGFRPTRMAQQYDRQTAAREIDQFWVVRKEMLMRQAYRDKFVYKDVDAYKETMRQIQSYNREVFDKKYLITREGLMQSMKNRAKAVVKTETGQGEPPQLRSAMDRMFPETVDEKKVR